MAFMKMNVYSPAMKRCQDVNIYYPDNAETPRHWYGPRREFPPLPDGTFRYPVLYLIHGGGGNYMNWPLETTLDKVSKERNVVIVMPNVNDRQDSMEFSGETQFVGEELPRYLRYILPLTKDPAKTYIGGFSFGGYFSWHTAILYPETFGVAASFSSPIDIIADLKLRPQENYDLKELETSDHNLIYLIEQKLKKGEKLPKFFESFGDYTDMCNPINKSAIDKLNRLGLKDWFWIQGLGNHSLDTCDKLVRMFFQWLEHEENPEKDRRGGWF